MIVSRAQAGPPPVNDAEFAFTWEDFRKIAALVHGEAGIVLAENKAGLVYSRLAKRLRAIGLQSFRDYCTLLQGTDGIDERQAMIAAMTTNVTRFFREPHHFEHLSKTVLPNIAARARKGEKIRLWSAACSSGEEPYSIALALLQAMPDAADRDVLILASDIDPTMLERATAGVYPAARLADIPVALRSGNVEMDRIGTEPVFRISPRVQALVRFRHLNLLKDWPLNAQFDAIFCRNVMIYFDQQTQDNIWSRFAARMKADAHLYIGHSERIATDTLPFRLTAQTTYRLERGT